MYVREKLKGLFHSPDYYIEIFGQNDFSLSYRLQYFGDFSAGGFHFQSKGLLSEQKKYKYIALESERWSQIIKVTEDFMCFSSGERNAVSNWIVNAFTEVKIKTPNSFFEVNLSVDAPNDILNDFINSMIEFCPILGDEIKSKSAGQQAL